MSKEIHNGCTKFDSIRVELAACCSPTASITLPYSIGLGRFECRLTLIRSNGGGLEFIRPLTEIDFQRICVAVNYISAQTVTWT